MDKIICSHCKRNEDLTQLSYSEGGGIVGHIYLCTVCRAVVKTCKLTFSFEFDEKKLEAIKRGFNLQKKEVVEEKKVNKDKDLTKKK